MKRLSDAELEIYAQTASKWGLMNPSGYYQAIQVELQLRTIDELRRIYGATH